MVDYNSIVGVKDRFGEQLLVSKYDRSSNECIVVSYSTLEAGILRTYSISRSMIVESDSAILACCIRVRDLFEDKYRDLLKAAIEHYRNNTLPELGRTYANTNQQVQLPSASGSNGSVSTSEAITGDTAGNVANQPTSDTPLPD